MTPLHYVVRILLLTWETRERGGEAAIASLSFPAAYVRFLSGYSPFQHFTIIRCVVYGRKCHFYFHLHFFTEQRDRSMCETIERAERGTRDVQVDVQRQQGRRRVVAVDAVIAKRHHVNKREIDVVMKNRTRILRAQQAAYVVTACRVGSGFLSLRCRVRCGARVRAWQG